MRRPFVARWMVANGGGVGPLLAQALHLENQGIDLALLADDHLVQLLDQVFGKAGLDFQLGQAVLVAINRVHGPIRPEPAVQAATAATSAGDDQRNRVATSFTRARSGGGSKKA